MSYENNRIIIFDTTLRDGEQTPGVNLNLSEKLEIARQLEALGVDVIEAGFPAASPGDFEAVRGVSQNVSCSVAALCRCVPDDITKGWEAVKYSQKPRLHVFLATSDIHMKYKLRMEPDQVLARAVEGVKLAKSFCEDVEFSCEDASRSTPEFLYRILEAVIEAGATTVNIPDTVGYAMPEEFGELIAGIRENVPNIDKAIISVHCHNDLGLAVANTISALRNGARQIETTINGLGERAGNCSMEEVVMGITTRSGYFGLEHGVDTTRIYRTSQRVAKHTGVPVPVCKAIVGANAFAHESGIHQHGVLANPMTYEIMTPQSVGKTESTMVLGKLSGRHAFNDRLESMGYKLTKEEIDTAFQRFKELADRKKNISDDDLEALVSQRVSDVPDYYKLETFQIQSGNKMQAMASVTLIHEEQEITEAATGDGPVDAAYNAVARIVGGEWPLAAYDIRAVTEGMDALGEVTVRIKQGERLYTGRGLAPDVIEASVNAYVNGINRAFASKAREEI
ncbi:2-isopropylmalate synthase [Oscillospiraceae bacterium MB08-C2-2]|nr:2-isopropylmalate synthase [Oscillospiraceae bacterium MB08-C2-2]